LINFSVPIIDSLCPIKYSPNTKYDNSSFYTCILDFVDKQVSWRKYKGTHEYPINGKYLNKIHNKFVKYGVYNKINEQILIKYLSTEREKKLKYQAIDTSFVANKQCVHNLRDKKKNKKKYDENINHNLVQFNSYNGRKKYAKLSAVTDSFGIPLVLTIVTGTDINTIQETINKVPVDLKTKRNSTHNRYKQSLLADAGYCSDRNKQYLKKKDIYLLLLITNVTLKMKILFEKIH